MTTAPQAIQDFFKQRFYSYQELNEALNIFQTTFFQILVVRTSRPLELDHLLQTTFLKKSIKYKCKHGGKSRTKITNGSRPNQHTYCTECPFEANLILVEPKPKLSSCYSDTRPHFKFSSYKFHHNHPISAEHFASYSTVNTVKLTQNKDAVKLLNVLDRAKRYWI